MTPADPTSSAARPRLLHRIGWQGWDAAGQETTRARSAWEYGRGLLLGALLTAALLLVPYLQDRRLLNPELPAPGPLQVLLLLGAGLVMGLATETLLRGLAYPALARRLGVRPAAVWLALLFALVATCRSGDLAAAGAGMRVLGLTLAGVVLARATVVPGTIWFAAGLHGAWRVVVLFHEVYTRPVPGAAAVPGFGGRADLTDAPVFALVLLLLLPAAGRLARPWFRTRRGRLALAVVLVPVFMQVWHGGLHRRVLPLRWGPVAGGCVYRSGQLTIPVLERTLHRHGIVRIIDLTDPATQSVHRDAEARLARRLRLRYIAAPLEGDGRGEIESYVKALVPLAGAVNIKSPTLVHCQAGTQRAGGVVAMYRLLVERRPAPEVLAEMRAYDWRPVRDRRLVEFLDANMAVLARRLVEEGVIAEVPDPLPRLGAPAAAGPAREEDR